MTVAIIIARGGSIRLPRKNVKPFCGHPLVAWTIRQSIATPGIDYTVVSTDDDEIENISLNYGAEVIRRPDWPDADQAAGTRPTLHALEVLADTKGLQPEDSMASLLPTQPIRQPADLQRAILAHERWGEHVLFLARKRETIVQRVMHPMKFTTMFFDKEGRYGECAGGIGNIGKVGYYKDFMTQTPLDDSDAANDKSAEGWGLPKGTCNEHCFVEIEPFQLQDVDTLPEFELAEVIMENFILKGRSIDEAYDPEAVADLCENIKIGDSDD